MCKINYNATELFVSRYPNIKTLDYHLVTSEWIRLEFRLISTNGKMHSMQMQWRYLWLATETITIKAFNWFEIDKQGKFYVRNSMCLEHSYIILNCTNRNNCWSRRMQRRESSSFISLNINLYNPYSCTDHRHIVRAELIRVWVWQKGPKVKRNAMKCS